jgi:hypothetical protein
LPNLVTAQSNDFDPQNLIRYTVSEIGTTFVSIFGPILGLETYDQFVFAKILFFFIILSIVHIALRNVDIFGSNRGALFIVTIAVSVLSTRYLPDTEIIRSLLIPYSAFGTAVIVIFPTLLVFIFTRYSTMGPFFRIFFWFTYGIIYFFTWFERTSIEGGIPAVMHWILVIGGLFILINIFADPWVQKLTGKIATQKWLEGVNDSRLARLEVQLEGLREIDDPSPRVKRNIRRIERQLRRG